MKKQFLQFSVLVCFIFSILFVACDDDDEVAPESSKSESFVTLSSPYLICANRNPGGIGFDFEYKSEKGGANNLDSVTVSDFEYDIMIRTISAEKADGALAGMPFFKLKDGVQAVNYSAVDSTCKGLVAFRELTASNLKNYAFKSDDSGFSLDNVSKGTTGKLLVDELLVEYAKLVIGQKWKANANNSIDEDELLWIIKTKEGRLVKFIVTQFPAKDAPTATGYVAAEWGFLN